MNGLAQDDAVSLDQLPRGTTIEVKTRHHSYRVENLGEGHALISGHPQYCPDPIEVDVYGSSWNGFIPQPHMLARGMQMEFGHPHLGVVRTSRIEQIRRI
jgi:hypothetical protein